MTWAIQDEQGNWLYSSLTLCAKYVKFCATRFIWSKIYIFNLLFYSVLTTGKTVNLSHRVQLNQNKKKKKICPVLIKTDYTQKQNYQIPDYLTSWRYQMQKKEKVIYCNKENKKRHLTLRMWQVCSPRYLSNTTEIQIEVMN